MGRSSGAGIRSREDFWEGRSGHRAPSMLDYGFLDFVLEQSWKRRLGVFVSWGSGDGGRVGDLGLELHCRRMQVRQFRMRCWR